MSNSKKLSGYASVLEWRKKRVQKLINSAADKLIEAHFLHKMDHPDGVIFIEGEGSINALSQANEDVRQYNMVASVQVPKGTFDCGAW